MADWLPSGPFYRFGLALLRASTQTAGVRDVLAEVVPLTPGTRFRMRFPGGTVDPPVDGANQLQAVLVDFDRRFSEFLAAGGVRLDQVAECEVVATRGRRGLRYAVEVKDYRGWCFGAQIVFPPTAGQTGGADPTDVQPHVVIDEPSQPQAKVETLTEHPDVNPPETPEAG